MSEILSKFGEPSIGWLNDVGPDSDIALFTRARLARNLASFSFPHHAADSELVTLKADLTRRMNRLPAFAGSWKFDLAEMSDSERKVLQEKMVASHRLVSKPIGRALVVSRDLSQTVMINEADHLRLHSYQAGFQPQLCLQQVMNLDDEMDQEVQAAFSSDWGYLTSSPTHVGTGLRLSSLLHLPGLVMVGEIDKVLNALRQLQFNVRGLFGVNGTVRGDLFQISNLITLGRDESEIVDDFSTHVGKIVRYERLARNQLTGRDHLVLEDSIHRSLALLAKARLMTAQEAYDCLSQVRLGAGLGVLSSFPPGALNHVTIQQQTGHLELAAGQSLAGRQKGAARAALLREFFAQYAN
jgi:protein arginine kinase